MPLSHRHGNTEVAATWPQVGISSCLLGENVRYDGGHKRSRFLTDRLAPFVCFVPVCPEMGIGLGAPREAIRLTGGAENLRIVGSRSGRDVTGALEKFGRERAAGLQDLCGYVFKSRSPSCGLARVPVYDARGKRTAAVARGIYAETITRAFPWLPVEDEGRLNDPLLRDNFLVRVFTLNRLRRALEPRPSARALVAFHTDHKYLMMAHNTASYRRLGRLVAEAGTRPIAELTEVYREELMRGLARVAGVSHHANVLQHLLGHLRGHLDSGDRAEIAALIERFRSGRLPLAALRILLLHHFRRHPDPFVTRQVYFEPYPEALAADGGVTVSDSAARWAGTALRKTSSA